MSLDLFPDQPMINVQRLDLRPLSVSDTGQIAQQSADLRIARITSRIENPCTPVRFSYLPPFIYYWLIPIHS